MKKERDFDVVLFGGGPANLMAASVLLESDLKVALFEQNSQIGKKFLLAGKSGLNLSMDKNLDEFCSHYYRDEEFIKPFLNRFSVEDQTRYFENTLGLKTYIGSAGKRFPEENAPIFLKTWINHLKNNGLSIFTHHKWLNGDKENHEVYNLKKKETVTIRAKKAVFGFGGNSWQETGSSGSWASIFEQKGIEIKPFQPSNSGVSTNIDAFTFSKWEGSFIKNCTVSFENYSFTGEIRFGKEQLEGSPIYHANHIIREGLKLSSEVEIKIDFKPQWSQDQIDQKWKSKYTLAKNLKNLKVSTSFLTVYKGLNLEKSAKDYIKKLPVKVYGFGSLDKSISTIGGVCISELNLDLSLKKQQSWYVSGEMIDWDAPTGGYLLSACFAMGKVIAEEIKSN